MHSAQNGAQVASTRSRRRHPPARQVARATGRAASAPSHRGSRSGRRRPSCPHPAETVQSELPPIRLPAASATTPRNASRSYGRRGPESCVPFPTVTARIPADRARLPGLSCATALRQRAQPPCPPPLRLPRACPNTPRSIDSAHGSTQTQQPRWRSVRQSGPAHRAVHNPSSSSRLGASIKQSQQARQLFREPIVLTRRQRHDLLTYGCGCVLVEKSQSVLFRPSGFIGPSRYELAGECTNTSSPTRSGAEL